ncbi:DNA starvation/stationary phase protection protein Dps [Halorussus limi]|uniref:DNA starvation/stationary phase protection protein Dps n=1 Tax=Halorussus limi TaxID=2938695 RepID=A0A8U0HYB6_9EURY|nr:DNA starvation/stationary phase protection protein Dps [Halorussus limi]UPV75534.1 DNA starvation/stationary phase protection protein Dps [Halorussus limi]
MSSQRQSRRRQSGPTERQRQGSQQSRTGTPFQTGQQSGNGRRHGRTYRSAVGLPDETRRAMVGLLNQTLADTTDLMTQCKFAHWNVKGMNFYQLHLLFDEIAETLEEHADIVAERATALGGEATGTVRTAAANSRIPEIPPDATTGPEYVAALVDRVGIHANNLRREIEIAVERDDEDTADMYTELSREVDKQLYFLEAHLQAVSPEAIPENPGGSLQGGQQSQGDLPSQYRQQSQTGHPPGQRRYGGPRQ